RAASSSTLRSFRKRQPGILPGAKAAAKRLHAREAEPGQSRNRRATPCATVAIDDHGARCVLGDLAAAILQLGQRDVGGVRQAAALELVRLAHVEHERILLVEE